MSKKAFTFSVVIHANDRDKAIEKFKKISSTQVNITERSEDVQEYVENEHGGCPKCGKDADVSGGSFEVSGNQVWQEVACHDCGGKFNDVYTLTDVEILR